MAPTISKFYLHEAASPNVGTLPSNSPADIAGGKLGTGTEAPGANTARDATDTIGTANPDTETTCTSQAVTSAQRLGIRRFVTRPLASQQLLTAQGNWTLSAASFESNAAHNGRAFIWAYAWRPSTGAQVAGGSWNGSALAEPGTGETAATVAAAWDATTLLLDGDVIVFDIYDQFTQGTGVSRTFTFCFDGTTEASTTTNAAFVTPPIPLLLYSPRNSAINLQNPGVL